MRRVFLGAAATVFTVFAARGLDPAQKANLSRKDTCQAIWDFAYDPHTTTDAKGKSDKRLMPCGSNQYSFLLATVPDPVNTHLALFFDRSVESIQNAVSDAGYEFAAYSFPWDPLLSRDEPDV